MIKEQVLSILYNNKGEIIPTNTISSKIGISKTELVETIESLITEGYPIDSLKSGYRLNITNLLLPYEIKSDLETNYMGKKIYFFKEVGSTNLVAKELADKGAPEGTIVIAESQYSGKASHGRKWISPSGGVWMTTILRPDVVPNKAPQLTLVTGVAVAETLIQEYGLNVEIKWPNDILIDNKKVCGILTEVKADLESVEYVLVGIGIDINLDIDNFPEELRDITTTLKAELEKEVKRTYLIQKFLQNFEDNYNKFKTGNFHDVLNKWRDLPNTIGKYVELHRKGGVIRGEAVGISKNGTLILERDDGTLQKIISGECVYIS